MRRRRRTRRVVGCLHVYLLLRLQKMNVEVVESKLADGEPAALSQFTLRFKPPNEWPSTAFKLHRLLDAVKSTAYYQQLEDTSWHYHPTRQYAVLPTQTTINSSPRALRPASSSSILIVVRSSTPKAFSRSMVSTYQLHSSIVLIPDIAFILAEEKPLTRLKSMKMSVRKTFRKRSLRMSRVRLPHQNLAHSHT